jgi:excisionase family DNA binding protein
MRNTNTTPRETPNRPARRRRRPVQAVQPEPGRQALTVPETAYELNVHPNTVWNLIRDGELKSFTLGRRRLVARSAIEDLMARGGTADAS